MSHRNEPPMTTKEAIAYPLMVFLAIVLFLVLLVGLWAGVKSFKRYQRVADANNQIKVIDREVRQTEAKVALEEKKADIRRAEAQGIADSQKIIADTLTPEYLTYLSIQAQMDFANSNNDTVIYIPVGDNGIPIIRDTSNDGAQETAQP